MQKIQFYKTEFMKVLNINSLKSTDYSLENFINFPLIVGFSRDLLIEELHFGLKTVVIVVPGL